MLEYTALNESVFSKVPVSALKILDVGCGTGVMGSALKKQVDDRLVYGITYSEKESDLAKAVLDKVLVLDINYKPEGIDLNFDCIIFSHVLEHTYYPAQVIQNFSQFLSDNGIVIIALPNVLYYRQRIEFTKGNFKYSDHGGLMDNTHFRFFDWETAEQMILDSRLKILSKEGSGNFPLPGIRKFFPSFGKALDKYSSKQWPGLFSFQFVFVAKK